MTYNENIHSANENIHSANEIDTKTNINPASINDCWIYSDNNVYNIIEFIEYTPKDLKNTKKIFNYEDTKTLLLSKMSNVFNYFWKSN